MTLRTYSYVFNRLGLVLLMTQTMQAKLSMNCKTCHASWISSDGLRAKLFAILAALLTVLKCSYFRDILGQVLTASQLVLLTLSYVIEGLAALIPTYHQF